MIWRDVISAAYEDRLEKVQSDEIQRLVISDDVIRVIDLLPFYSPYYYQYYSGP